MTIEPAVLIAFIAAILGLLGLFFRMFASGDLLSKNVVLRSDYDRVVTINEGYAGKFGEQTAAVAGLATTIDKLVTTITARPASRR